MRARSTAASVCPARTSTPPVARAQRKHVTRARQIGGPASPDRSPRRSCARDRRRKCRCWCTACASIGTQNAVPNARGVLRSPSAESPARRAARRVIGRQISPRPCLRHEVDRLSGVTFSAAIVRSPSFSRSSSSTTMIILPARIASIASSIGQTACRSFRRPWRSCRIGHTRRPVAPSSLHRRARHVLSDHVAFEIDASSSRAAAGSCASRYTARSAHRSVERSSAQRQADAVHRNRALEDEIRRQRAPDKPIVSQ